MRWGERNSVQEKCDRDGGGVVCVSGGGWWWQSGLWSNTTPRSDHLSVFLYLLLFFVGEGVGVESHEKQKNSQSTCRSCLVK